MKNELIMLVHFQYYSNSKLCFNLKPAKMSGCDRQNDEKIDFHVCVTASHLLWYAIVPVTNLSKKRPKKKSKNCLSFLNVCVCVCVCLCVKIILRMRILFVHLRLVWWNNSKFKLIRTKREIFIRPHFDVISEMFEFWIVILMNFWITNFLI